MSNLSFYNRLQLYGSRLSKSEQRIADFVLNDPDYAATAGSQELSAAINTSGSTLTRFCQKLEYRNFVEFQTLLAGEKIPARVSDPVMKKIAGYYADILDSSDELVTPGDIDAFTEQLFKAERIFIFGLGSSGLTAAEFNTRLLQMGFTSNVMTDSLLMQAQSGLFSATDLVIAISSSGKTPEVLRACSIASSVGAKICVITQGNDTELMSLADTVLYAGDIRRTNDPKFINAQLPLMFMVDVISYRLMEKETCRENRKKALENLYGHSV